MSNEEEKPFKPNLDELRKHYKDLTEEQIQGIYEILMHGWRLPKITKEQEEEYLRHINNNDEE